MARILVLVFYFLVCAGVQGARILGIVHMPLPSHYILGNRLFEELANRGHEVTFISGFSRKTPVNNLKDITLDVIPEVLNTDGLNMFDVTSYNKYLTVAASEYFAFNLTQSILNHPNVRKLLKSNEKFDLIIMTAYQSEAFYGLSYHYKCPLILMSTMGRTRVVNPQVGNPTNPAYIPEVFSNYFPPLTFFERVDNTLFLTYAKLVYYLISLPINNYILHQHFPDAPSMSDLFYNVSLVLLNSDVSTNQPVPGVPNMIDIGGFHVRPPGVLPKDIKEYLDGAKDGAIYFSMGSHLKSKDMDPGRLQAVLNVFSKLKQKVLWKWEDETLPGKPANVKIGKWLPQQDILAHPNIVLFITHGGLLSTIESIYHGKPVVTIPVIADQIFNAAIIENAGYGKSLPYYQLDETKLELLINEVLTNSKYQDNVILRSKIMNDQLTKPLDRAVYWVEYVIRYNGAPHLRNFATSLTWYQYLLLDVFGFLILIGSIWMALVYFLCVKCCCKRKTRVSVNKKNK